METMVKHKEILEAIRKHAIPIGGNMLVINQTKIEKTIKKTLEAF